MITFLTGQFGTTLNKTWEKRNEWIPEIRSKFEGMRSDFMRKGDYLARRVERKLQVRLRSLQLEKQIWTPKELIYWTK